jgi:S1-C subfamily serine protease
MGKLFLFAMVGLAALLMEGCASTPEQEAVQRQSEAQKLQRRYATYSTPQLRLKRQEIAASIPSWYWGTGIAGMIQQGQIEGRKNDLAEIDRELLRRAESGDQPGRRSVSFLVVSDPLGARIELDGQYHGITPNVITGAVDVATTLKIRVTPASLDRPTLGFVMGYTNLHGVLTADLFSVGVCSFVVPNTPASRMGMLTGDKIVGVNGRNFPRVTGTRESASAYLAAYREQMSRTGFGGDVTVKVLRNGEEQELRGQTCEQVEGTYYTQEKTVQPLRFNKSVIFFDMRTQTDAPTTLGAAGGRASPAKGGSFTGTGFVVAEGGYILTCQHVVEKAEDIEVRDQAGTRHKARVIAADAGNDLSLLCAEKLTVKPIPSAPPNSVATGEAIYCLGYPMEGVSLENLTPVAGNGIVASLRGLHGDPRHLQVTTPINPGNSGGPILDTFGRWVAVASHKLNDFYSLAKTESVPQGVNFAVKGTLAVPLLGLIPEVKVPVGDDKERLTLEDAAKRLSGSIVLITAKH